MLCRDKNDLSQSKKVVHHDAGSRNPFFENEESLQQGRSIDEALRPIEAVEPTAGAVATPEGLHISPSATDGF
jgi:hypothetical protein